MRPLLLIFLLLCSAPLFALDLKTPPPGGLYDPGSFLDEKFSAAIKFRLEHEFTHRQFEVFVLLFEKEPSQGAEILARQAGESWSQGEYWSVIYQVGQAGEPNCLAGGRKMAVLDQNVVDRRLRGVRGTAMMVGGPQNRLEAMVSDLTSALGLLRVQADEAYKAAVQSNTDAWVARKLKREKLYAAAAVLGVVLLGLAFVGYIVWKKRFRKLKPMEFPLTSPRHRLAGPFSAGGDVLVKYGRKH